MAEYRFLLADLLSGTVKDEIPLDLPSFSRTLCGVGGFAAELPLSIKTPIVAAVSYFSTVLNDGPVGFWRLGERSGTVATDFAPAANNGVYTGTLTMGDDGLVQGDVNRALTLAGAGYVSIPHSANQSMAGGAFTLGAIVKLASYPGVRATVVSKYAAANQGWQIALDHTGHLVLQIWNGGSTLLVTLTGATALALGAVHYVACTINFDTTLNVYTYSLWLDGVLDGSTTTVAAPPSSGTAPVTIGARDTTLAESLSGTVDEVEIYQLTLSSTRLLVHAFGVQGQREATTFQRELCTESNLDAGRTLLWVHRDDQLVWGGILWGVDVDSDTQSIKLAANGLLSYFDHRFLRQTMQNASIDQLQIVQNLIDYAQGVAGGNLGVTVVRTPTNSGVTQSYIAFGYERRNILQELTTLAATITGFDFELVVSGNALTGGTITKQLLLGYPHLGSTGTGLVWQVGRDVALVQYTKDATVMGNYEMMLGAGSGLSMLAGEFSDLSQLGNTMLLERVDSQTTITDQNVLNALAVSTLYRYRHGQRTVNVRLMNPEDAPVGSFGPGDQVRLIANSGFLNIDELWRIMSMTVTPDVDGNESIDVGIAPVAAFGA